MRRGGRRGAGAALSVLDAPSNTFFRSASSSPSVCRVACRGSLTLCFRPDVPPSSVRPSRRSTYMVHVLSRLTSRDADGTRDVRRSDTRYAHRIGDRGRRRSPPSLECSRAHIFRHAHLLYTPRRPHSIAYMYNNRMSASSATAYSRMSLQTGSHAQIIRDPAPHRLLSCPWKAYQPCTSK